MFNKTVFKQTAKANSKLLIIITVVLSIFITILTKVFDPAMISSMTSMMESSGFGDMISDTSFLSMMSQSFYSMQAVILPLIFIIVVGSSLIVSQVDRGAMAYTLSTPIKRTTVAFTNATFFVLSLAIMFTIFSTVGILAIQGFYGTIWGEYITPDVKALSQEYSIEPEDLESELYLILDNPEALEIGAEKRHMDIDTYETYLNLKIADNINKSVADLLEIEPYEVNSDPTLILNNEDALKIGATEYGISVDDYKLLLQKSLQEQGMLAGGNFNLQENLLTGLTAASEDLDMDVSDLSSDLGILKDEPEALATAVEVSGIPEEMFMQLINNNIASDEIAIDNGIDIDLTTYFMLNFGLFLLMFATSSISFLCSCFFNLSNKYMAFGAGIPLAFFLFDMMAKVNSSLEPMKYLTINSLYDTDAIISGEGYALQFLALFIIGVVLYFCSITIFKKKDLPL